MFQYTKRCWKRQIWAAWWMAIGLLLCLQTVTLAQHNGGTQDIHVTLDGESVQFETPPALIEGTTVVPVQAVADPLDLRIAWSRQPETVHIVDRDQWLEFPIGQTVMLNRTADDPENRQQELSVAARTAGDQALLPLRALIETLGYRVSWHGEERTVAIETQASPRTSPAADSADAGSNQAERAAAERAASDTGIELTAEERDLFLRVVASEALGEPLQGKIAVAAVVLNRVEDSRFPDNVWDVLTAPGQFYVISNGMAAQVNPTEADKEAIERALQGEDPSQHALYFYDPERASSDWIRTVPVTTTIGNHRFAAP